jgi:hypothetical protein
MAIATQNEISQQTARALLDALRELAIEAEAAGWDIVPGSADVLDAARAAIAAADGSAA